MRMRRISALVAVILIATPAFALNRSRVHAGDRVGVLESIIGGHNGAERALVRELQQRGVDAFAADVTYDELVRGSGGPAAVWYVEIAVGGIEAPTGGIAVGLGPVATTVDVVQSDIVAQVRLFDARTLDEIERYDVQRRGKNIVPAGVGLGIWPFRAWLPVRWSRDNEIARETAARILQESR
jgi:hypothetical protein